MASTIDPKVQKPNVRKERKELEVDKLFTALVKLEGSDLHLKVDCPPHVRVKGSLRPLSRGPIDDDEMERLLLPMLDDRNRKIYEERPAAPTLPTAWKSMACAGVSASTCSARWGTWGWWLAA